MKNDNAMKKILVLMMAAAAVACGKELPDYPNSPQGAGTETGSGSLHIGLTVAPLLDARTRAEESVELSALGITAPDPMLLRTLVSNKDRSASVHEGSAYIVNSTVSGFNSERPELPAGDYFITLGSTKRSVPAATRTSLPDYTAPDGAKVLNVDAPYHAERLAGTLIPQIGEGENLPYYEATGSVTVAEGETAEVQLVATLANTVVTVDFTDRFKNYFENGAEIHIDTKALTAGSSEVTTKASRFTVKVASAKEWASYEKRYFFVRPQQSITLSGSALRQDPSPDMGLNKPVTLSAYTSEKLAPRTLYTFRFDVSEAGSTSGKITVTLNDEPVGEVDEDIELNPNAPQN